MPSFILLKQNTTLLKDRVIPRSEQKLVKSIEVKLLPLSHLILFGRPCSAKTSSNNLIVVAVSILSELLTTIKCEKWSSIKGICGLSTQSYQC